MERKRKIVLTALFMSLALLLILVLLAQTLVVLQEVRILEGTVGILLPLSIVLSFLVARRSSDKARSR